MTIVNREPPVPDYSHTVSADGDTLTLKTQRVTLMYNRLELGDIGHASCETLNVTIKTPGGSGLTTWCPEMGVAPPSQKNLNGSLETGDCYVGWADCIDVYDQKMQPGVLARSGYSVINDTSAVLLTKSTPEYAAWPGGWRLPRPHAAGSYTDLLFFGHGHDYRGALADWRLVAGAIPLSPWRSTGVWWTRYYPYGEKTWTEEVWDGFVANSLPLHMVVLDTDWHTHNEPACPHNSQGYKWNRTLFPDPPRFQKWIHDKNMSLMVNIHDQGLFDSCQHNYKEVMLAVNDSGWQSNASLLCHFESEAWSTAVHALVLETGEDAGIDYLWTDFGGAPSGEFTGNAEWQCKRDSAPTGLTSTGVGPATPGHGYIDLGFNYGNGRTPASLWAEYVRYSRQIVNPHTSILETQPTKPRRGYRMGINGGYGSHRYPVTGAADQQSSYTTMVNQMYMGLAAANIGSSWGWDLGAFYMAPPYGTCAPGDTDGFQARNKISCSHPKCLDYPGNVSHPGGCMHEGEIFTRWLQFGVFSATFRTHCEACEIRVWMYPEPYRTQLFRTYHIRQALQPYTYTAGWKAHRTGVQPVRGMYIDFPEEEQAYNLSRMVFDNSFVTNPTNVSQEIQFSFGDDFFVSPVSRPMQKESDQPHARRRLDDGRPFVITNGSCCGPAKMSPHSAVVADRTALESPEQAERTDVDPSGFTIYAGDWCTGGTKPSSIQCHHAPPIGGIQPCTDAKTCESRCKANSKCLAFAWQAAKCYLWPCYAMGVERVTNPGSVCGNRSAVTPGPLPPPSPSPPRPPGPPPPGPTACPQLGTPIANFPAQTLEECRSSCDFTSGTAAVGCSTFEYSPYVSNSLPNCKLWHGWPSYINTSAAGDGRICANRTGGFYPAPSPPPSGHPGKAVQDVWIPGGAWMHWDSGEVVSGPKTIVTANDLKDIPAYVRNGAVIPLSSNTTVHELAPDPLRLVVIASGDASGEAEVYEDEGEYYDFTSGAFRIMRVNHTTARGVTTLAVRPRAEGKGYAGERAQRTLQVEIRLGPQAPAVPKRVVANGKPVADVAVRPACDEVACAYLGPALLVRAAISPEQMDTVWTLQVVY